MVQKVLHFDWNWQLHATAEELWPLISDTNRLFNNLNLPPVQAADLSYDYKKGHTQLGYNSLQNSDAWEEEPFEWERPFRFGVQRRYKNGTYNNLKVLVDLLPNDQGTRVRYQVWAEPRNALALLLAPVKFHALYRRRLRKTLNKIDALFENNQLPYQTESPKKLSKGGQHRLNECKQELIAKTGEKTIVSNLVELMTQARNIDLQYIEPFKLADKWDQPRHDVLGVFLHAAKAGLLNFNWNLHCSQCRTRQQCCKTLSEIHEPVFCNECRKEFHVNFNQNVQLSFRPNPLVRKISGDQYAITGPHTKPHVAVKQFLKPGEKRYLKIRLEEGSYNLRIQGLPGVANIEVHSDGQENVTVSVNQRGLNGEQVHITPEPNVVFRNKSDRDQIFILEKAQWNDQKLTAAQATSLQLFRNLFDKEVLRKGEQIAIENQTLMFTDLFDSTGMYNKEGDETAVGRVIEHFDVLQKAVADQNGAVVKTIGDSVMAVFSNPVDAFRAFINAHDVISKDARFNNRLKLKAGIHHGSCVAVNLNNKIDYFGCTVNIASRLVDFAGEDEVVLSKSVGALIDSLDDAASKYMSETTNINLRGFEDEEFAVKRLRLKQSSLRLVV